MALQLADPSVGRGFIFTFVGEGGLGKTALGASFPSPIFIPTEDGLIPPNVDRFPLCKSSDEVIQRLREVGADPDQANRTVVLDTITQLNILIEQEIVDGDSKNLKALTPLLADTVLDREQSQRSTN